MIRRARVAVVLLAVGAGAVIGCARREDDKCTDATPANVVDPVLLSFLSRARSAHRAADLHEEQKRVEQAIAELQALVSGPLPNPAAPPVEAREVIADTEARLADLKSRIGQFDAAAAHVGRGLELASDATYFRGHLFEVQGLLEERRGAALRASGDETGARAAVERALKAYEEAMSVQAEAIRRAVPAQK